jgi:hypothetical protein
MLTRAACALGLMLLAGCASESIPASPPADHPANPAAAESELPPPSHTLALAPTGPDAAHKQMSSGSDQSRGSPSEEHAHHQHADAQQQPSADAATPMTPGANGGPHAGHLNQGGAAKTRPATTQPLYVCPMHPEVVSLNPNDLCPKCNMKINKPVRPATAPAPVPAPLAPAGGHDAHQGHGGH